MYRVGAVTGGSIVAVGGDVVRDVLSFGRDDVYVSFGFLSGGAAVAVGPCFGRCGHMIVYHSRKFGDVESAGSEIGGYEYRGRAVCELDYGIFAIVLVKASMVEPYR